MLFCRQIRIAPGVTQTNTQTNTKLNSYGNKLV